MSLEEPGTKTSAELIMELQTGARFVVFQYCVSLLVVTFKRSSDVYLVKPGESAVRKGIRYTLLSLLLGWWGIPWGLIYTLESIVINLQGGRDVTEKVVGALLPMASAQERSTLERLVPQAAAGKPGVTTEEFSKAISAADPFSTAQPEPGVRRRQVLVLAALVAVGLCVLALAVVGLGEWGQRTDSLKAGVWGLPAQATATWEARLAIPAPTVAPGYALYTSEDLGFSVHHPEGWLVEVGDLEEFETDGLATRSVDFSTPAETPEEILAFWVQCIWQTRGSPSATPTDQECLELVNNLAADRQLEPLEDTYLLDVNGFRAARGLHSFTNSYTSQATIRHTTILFTEDRIFAVVGTGVSDNQDELRSVYDHFLASFRVLPLP